MTGIGTCAQPWKMGGYGRGTSAMPVHFSCHHNHPIELLEDLIRIDNNYLLVHNFYIKWNNKARYYYVNDTDK